MILRQLYDYYQRLAREGRVVTPGFQEKEIPFVIVLDRKGGFVDLDDTRAGEGKNRRARRFVVPREVKRSGKNAWQSANLLWDNEGYVVGWSATDSEKARRQRATFQATLRERLGDVEDEGIRAVLRFLECDDVSAITRHPLWADIAEKGGNLSFRLQGDLCLVSDRPLIRERIAAVAAGAGDGSAQACLITGEVDVPKRLHASIKGVRGANTTGANIVSFNLPAFASFGKEQSRNAPVGRAAEFAYTTALNTLLGRDSKQRLIIGDATAVFWAERRHEIEDVFADLFGEQPRDAPFQDLRQVVALYRSPQSGVRPELEPHTRFFVLGLAPNAARLAVRFWQAGTVGEVMENLASHFDDLTVTAPPNWPSVLPLRTLLKGIAAQGDLENVAPNLAGDFVKAVLSGTAYPRTLLMAALRRVRAERDITYPRAALIKAVLAREARIRGHSAKEVGMSLDQQNTNVGYRLGRLFAALEKVQEEASPGINATIRDRFYGAASATPVAAFPHLMKLKNHHLAKLENRGRAVNLERLIGEIVDGIDEFPAHLSLQDQGRFAVGYYHQRQDFFRKRETLISNS
jgi:CRISPR-associated protein Csd1